LPDLIHVNDLPVVRHMFFWMAPDRALSCLEGNGASPTVRGVLIMFRKTIIALIAVLAVAVVAPTEVSAWGRGGGFHGGFHGGGFGGFRGGFGGWHGGGWRGPGWGALGVGIGLGLAAPYVYGGYGYPYGYPYDYGSYYDYGSCYLVRQRVMTPWGWRVRRIEVCN
jgi:hypothetical protein